MRVPVIGARHELRVNMTPMIDVVFLLIIFFLVSSHLARQENRLPLTLPSAESGEEADVRRERVIVNLKDDGTMLVAGRTVDPAELERRLRNEKQSALGEFEVRIRSDRVVPFRFVQPVLLAISQSGVRNVTFAVTKRDN